MENPGGRNGEVIGNLVEGSGEAFLHRFEAGLEGTAFRRRLDKLAHSRAAQIAASAHTLRSAAWQGSGARSFVTFHAPSILRRQNVAGTQVSIL